MNDNAGKAIPKGWHKEFLSRQLDGLTGHIENAGYPFDEISWIKYDDNALRYYGDIWKWVPFEQTAYYLDGATRLSSLLENKELKNKTDKIIYGVINNPEKDSFLGPDFLRPTTVNNRWPHTVFFRAAIAKYYINHDKSIIKAIENHYLNSSADYSKTRNVTNIEPMLMVYEITHNQKLLDLAIKTYKDYHADFNKDPSACTDSTLESVMLSKKIPYEHGVTYNEIAKLGAILYGYTGKKEYLKPAINAYKKLEKYHMQVDGLHSSNEFLRGKSPSESHETCDISDYTWSLGYLLKATGDAHYADLIEKCIFNAGIGAVLEGFKALQYFSSVNQIVSDEHSNHCFYRYGKNWMSYLPTHETQCCPGNVNRFFPNYVSRMVMRKNSNIFVVFYGDSEFEIKFGSKKLVIIQESNYPFDEEIKISFKGDYQKPFKFNVRIPKWCQKPCVMINNEIINGKITKGFMKIENVISSDIIKIILPMEINLNKYKNCGISVTRGPILYALGMKGKREQYTNSVIKNKEFPGYKIYADKAWNYGINFEEAKPKYLKFNNQGYPWDLDYIPCGIEISAHKIPEFKEIRKTSIRTTDYENKSVYFTMKSDFIFTPKIKAFDFSEVSGEERIILYPYGASKLRMGVLPRIK